MVKDFKEKKNVKILFVLKSLKKLVIAESVCGKPECLDDSG